MQIANATTEARKKPIENEQKKLTRLQAPSIKILLFLSFMDQISILIFLLMHFRVTEESIGTKLAQTYSISTHTL
jgi:hypothetical protein